MFRKRITATGLIVALYMILAVGLCCISEAQTATTITPGTLSGLTITPGEATSNSVYNITFTFVMTDKSVWPDLGSMQIWFKDSHGNEYAVPIPEIQPPWGNEYWKVDVTSSGTSTTYVYHLRISPGLHLSDGAIVNPNDYWDTLILNVGGYNVLTSDWTSKGTVGGTGIDSIPMTWTTRLRGYFSGATTPEVLVSGSTVKVHDSYAGSKWENGFVYTGYNGVYMDRDYLYSYNEYGDRADVDPLITLRYDGQSPDASGTGYVIDPNNPGVKKYIDTPDDGTSSTSYTFQVLYVNRDGSAPVQYIPDGMVNRWSDESDSGVVLYLRNASSPDGLYYAYPMQAQGTDYAKGVIYKYVFGPSNATTPVTGRWMNVGDTEPYSAPFVSLPLGEYQYFFGCSDDIIRGTDEETVPEWQDPWPWAPGDPSLYHVWNWQFSNARYNLWPSDNDYNLDCRTSRVSYEPGVANDRRTLGLIPDYWSIYPYSSRLHPIVSLGLYGPRGEKGETYDGRYPWRGTVTPFRRAVDPVVNTVTKLNLETAGLASSEPVYFQIRYAELYGIFPEDNAGGEISVSVNNGEDDTAPYTKYPLARVTGDTGDVTGQTYGNEGVLYRTATPITLKPGPHTYFFTASDGHKFVRFPVGSALAGIGGNPLTNYLNGPYVNNPPTLTHPYVTPTSGTSGDDYKFYVTYTDPDGQRPYQANLVIQFKEGGTLENGGAIKTAMTKVNPTDSNFKAGVTYVFDSKSLAQVLQPGQRKFYFEFMDDWGSVTNTNDRVQGQTVWSVSEGSSGSYSGPTWISAPYIRSNQRPLLINGSVSAADGTSNVATLWTYKTTFIDADNQKPAYVNVYIGKKLSDGSISWDNGHAMQDVDANDQLFSDGKDYSFSTTLAGGDTAVQYYYCFVASDGIDVAQYDAKLSPSADVVWATAATSTTAAHLGERLLPSASNARQFTTTQHPLVGKITSDTVQGLYSEPIVYTDSGLQLTSGTHYDLPYATGIITLNDAAPATSYLDVQYLFGVPGPTSVGANTAPNLSNGTVNPLSGRSSDKFTYSVTYQDTDGTAGQAPTYIRVLVDGTAYAMKSVAPGNPNYKVGAQFSVQLSLTPGVHNYYFEASDGAGYCIYDANGARSSGSPILGFVPTVGPYVSDDPTLTNPTIIPTPTSTPVDVSQSLSYSVLYKDNNNDAPNAGYPVLYIDSPITATTTTEVDYNGKSTSVAAGAITDNTQNWTPHQFKGLPVQITSGQAQGYPYEVADNDATTLTLLTSNLVTDGVKSGDTFSVGKLTLFNVNPGSQTYSSGVTYGINIPGLGVGSHSAHFKSVTKKVSGSSTTKDVLVRTAEISGPTVAINTTDNHAPVLTYVSPTLTNDTATGQSTDKFMFTVNYQDADGDPPTLHNNVAGYIKVVIDGIKYDMLPPGSGMLVGVDYSYPDPALKGITLPAGNHKFHYESSDGYVVTTLPVTGDYTLTINQSPTLTNPKVTPLASNWGRAFVFSVTYSDVNNDPPYANASGTPQLWIDGALVSPTDADGNTVYTVTSDNNTWAQGKTYSFTLARNYFANQVTAHHFQFKAGDGKELGPDSEVINGPIIHENHAPALTLGSVSPISGLDNITYTYNVEYTDSDSDDPEYLNVEIDGGTPNGYTIPMTKVESNSTNYSQGVMYTAAKTGLPIGNHSYVFKTSDGLDSVSTNSVSKPVVTARPSATIALTPITDPVYVGIPVTVQGSVPAAPRANVTIQAQRPDGTSLGTHTVVTGLDGSFSDSWTFDVPSATTKWSLVASWIGDSSHAPSTSAALPVTVLARPTAHITVTPATPAVLGSPVTVAGSISFDPNAPLASKKVGLTVSGTCGTHSFSQNVTSDQNGVYTANWTPDITGTWTITASWAGNNTYPKTTNTATASVTGIPTTVNGLAMISVPMKTTSGFPDSILGKDIPYAVATWYASLNDYKIYSWFTGGRQDLQVITPGQGFWIKTYQSKTIAPSGSLWPAGTDCTIDLDGSGGGWNQIGSPFNTDVSWGALQVISNGTRMTLSNASANGLIRDYGWRYDTSKKSYVLVDANRAGAERSMKPWSGYWIRALASGLKLVIPAAGTVTNATSSTYSVKSLARASSSYDPASWLVTLVAKNGDIGGSSEYFGIAQNADRVESPASMEDYVDLYFTGNANGHYSSDIRVKSDTDNKWSFCVASDVTGDVQLSWAGLDSVPANSKLTLVDDATKKSVVMSPNGSYTFRSEAGVVSTFHITVETD